MIDQETERSCSSTEGKNFAETILTKLQEISKLLESNASIETLIKCSEALKDIECDELVFVEGSLVTNIVNDCISFLRLHFFSLQIPAETKYFHFEIFTILSLIKLKFLEHNDLIDYTNTSINVINYGIKLIKYCIVQQLYPKAEYYMERCKKTMESLLLKFSTSEGIPSIRLVKDMKITLELYQVEIMLNTENLDSCFDAIQKIKLKLPEFISQHSYFVRICYNTSLKLAKKENYDQAITVLVDAQKCHNCSNISGDDLFLIHSLLAAIYIRYRPEIHWRKCLESLNAAQKIDPKPVFLINMLRVAFYANEVDTLSDVMNQIKNSAHLTIEVVLSVIDELRQNAHEEAAVNFCRELRDKMTLLDDKLHIMREEMALHFERNCLESVSILLEDIASMAECHEFKAIEVQRLCKIVAQNAGDNFKAKHFSQCLTWFKKCCQLLQVSKCHDDIYLYFQQRVCLCYVEMDEGELAKEAFSSLECEPSKKDPLNTYLALQIAVMCEDEGLAEKALERIDEEEAVDVETALLTCCKRAFASGKEAFLCTLLEALLQKPSTGHLRAKAAQWLIRLHLHSAGNEEVLEKILLYLDKALDSLRNATPSAEARWFSRVSWNLGLQASGAEHVFRFLEHSCLFLEGAQCPRNSFVLAVAAGLHLLHRHKDETQVEEVSRKILSLIDKCRGGGAEASVLHLYEFECRLYLRDPSAENFLLRKMAHLDAKSLEKAAAIAYVMSPTHYQLSTKALKEAISKVRKSEPLDCDYLSKLYQDLTEMLFFTQDYLTATVAEDTSEVCEGLLKLLEDDSVWQGYPQIEVLWLMSKCWNRGIRCLCSGERGAARKWCALAMGFLQKLVPTYRALHEKRLTLLFSAYFGHLDPSLPSALV